MLTSLESLVLHVPVLEDKYQAREIVREEIKKRFKEIETLERLLQWVASGLSEEE